jgi:hypothetical protein
MEIVRSVCNEFRSAGMVVFGKYIIGAEIGIFYKGETPHLTRGFASASYSLPSCADPFIRASSYGGDLQVSFTLLLYKKNINRQRIVGIPPWFR